MLTSLLPAAALFGAVAHATDPNGRPGFYPLVNGTNSTTTPVQLHISTTGGGRNHTSPLLYGLMIEDISHSIDGGLYGELLANRAFQGSDFYYSSQAPAGFNGSGENNYFSGGQNPIEPSAPTLDGYQPIGAAHLTLDAFYPLSDALPNVMRVDIPEDATGEVGFYNEGYWGMQVLPQTYNASFYILPYQARGNYEKLSAITVSLRSNITGQTWASSSIPVANLSGFDYTQLTGQIKNTAQAPDSNNTFAVTFDASEVAGATFYVGFLSLFGETFNNRPNGMRKDLAEVLYDLKPQFLRCPGGNNIEGESIATRWKWNETIGPQINRKGRPGDWNYYNTNGFGLLEYLLWCEDFDMEPVLAVYAGYSLDKNSYPEDRMGDVLQIALDQLEYCLGDASSTYGALRARDGHPEPFDIKYVELGNEDFFSTTYPYRFPILYKGIKAQYPNLTLISTAYNEPESQNLGYNYTIDLPPGSMWDVHQYEEPTYFIEHFDTWDNWQATTNNSDVGILVGEYSNIMLDTTGGIFNATDQADRLIYPELVSVISEAVYLLGCERNPNTVKMSAYAPVLANFNAPNWTPNLITFTANPNDTILSASYYLQKMFNMYRGTETLPVTNTLGPINPLFWASSIDGTALYLKLVNSGDQVIPLTTQLDVPWSSVNGTIITGEDPFGYNYFNNKTAISAQPITNLGASNATQKRGEHKGRTENGTFIWNVPAYSVSVLQFTIASNSTA